MTNEERKRAVERVENEVFTCERGGLIRAPVVTLADLRLLLSERAELLGAVERMRGALIDLIEHAEECMASMYYHDAGMLGDEPVKRARAALTTGEEK